MASSEEVFELVEYVEKHLHQLQTMLSLAHDASDSGLTAEETLLRDRITRAHERFNADASHIREGRFARFLHRPRAGEAQDLARLEREFQHVQERRPVTFDVHVFEDSAYENGLVRGASHATRPYFQKAFENRKHFADHLDDARRLLVECCDGVIQLCNIGDEIDGEVSGPDSMQTDLEEMIFDKGRLPLAQLNAFYEEAEASFIVAASFLGYDRLGSHSEISNLALSEQTSFVDTMRFGLKRADESNQSLVYAALKPISRATEPTSILIVLDVDSSNEQHPIVIGQRGLAWGEMAIVLDAPVATFALSDLMTNKTAFDHERVSWGNKDYGGAVVAVPGLAAKVADFSTGVLENAPAYKHMANRYFSELRNLASRNSREDGQELSRLGPEKFGERILDAHVQMEAANDVLIIEGPGFGR